MTKHYKGVRIDELLEDIARLQDVLEATKDSVESVEEARQVVAGEATLAIMKAKLTALQGGY
jgi:DNA-binding protein YbaB